MIGEKSVIEYQGPNVTYPGSYLLTFSLDPYHIPASKEFIEIGDKCKISYCDIFGDKEGGYFSGPTINEINETSLAGNNGNISVDPLCIPPDYKLDPTSPCIDAGNPSSMFNDFYRPPGQGNERNDMGAHGGPENYLSTTVKNNNSFIQKITDYELFQNYPNPFNPTTNIEFFIREECEVKLQIYNSIGEPVVTLVSETLPAGKHNRIWNVSNISNGLYFYRLKANGFSKTKKMIVLK